MTEKEPAQKKRLFSPSEVTEAVELCYLTAATTGFPEPTLEQLRAFVAKCLHDWRTGADGCQVEPPPSRESRMPHGSS